MPRGSEALTNARKEEIINACAALYETKSFKDITLQDIGEKTSFTRTSIYNYFHTKEEIFLALLKREHEAWITDMEDLLHQHRSMDVRPFAEAMTTILEKRSCMLKLMSMNIYDMEVNSRMDNLVDFKTSYAKAFSTLDRCLKKFFPSMTDQERKGFLYVFFPFLFGIHPFTSHTEKQMIAMQQAGIKDGGCSIYELTKPFLLRLLKSFLSISSKW